MHKETKVPEGQGMQARFDPMSTDSKAELLLSCHLHAVPSVVPPPVCAPVSPPHMQAPTTVTQLLAQPHGAEPAQRANSTEPTDTTVLPVMPWGGLKVTSSS